MHHSIRIFIIDDHDLVRKALTAHLNSAEGMVVVGETANAEEGVHRARALRPDVVLVETKRADGRGLELVSLLVQCVAGSRIIVLTSYPSEWERWAAHRAGATSYLLKDIASPLLVEQIRAAALRDPAPAP